MSDTRRTAEEYANRYAISYCNGNVEEALKHKIVQEVLKEMEVVGNEHSNSKSEDC